MGSVQLLILAFSDIALSLWWVLGFVMRLLNDNNPLPNNIIARLLLYLYGILTGNTNRFLTIYIAYSRARIVWSLPQANRSLHKTEKDIIRETIFYGLTPSLLVGVATVTPI
jgi:hypothetical protein